MPKRSLYTTILVIQCVFSLFYLTGCRSTGEHFEIKYSSNADTVFLSWTPIKGVRFDSYQVADELSRNHFEVSRKRNQCFLTHIPYNTLVSIELSMMLKGEVVHSESVQVFIDGLDRRFASLLIPDKDGITGSDGAYSIALPDGRSVFLMGDSYNSPVKDGQRATDSKVYRNTTLIYDNGKVTPLLNNDGNPYVAVPPGVTDEGQNWYWPGDGFATENTLYVFQLLSYQGRPGAWGVKYATTHILEYNLPDLSLQKSTRIPFYGADSIHYGASALKTEDYFYIYAQVDVANTLVPISSVLVARTNEDNLYSKWEYFTTEGWSEDPAQAKEMQGLSDIAVSTQFNVFRLRDKYVLLSQHKAINSRSIYTFTSDTPFGPWSHKKLIYRIPQMSNSNWFAYNAVGHPQFEKDGMILISYNVNTSAASEHFTDVRSYRPRFVWIPIEDILN